MGPWWSVLFLYGHGQFSSKLFDALTDVCTTQGLKTGDYPDPEACQPLLDQINQEVAKQQPKSFGGGGGGDAW
jgi:cathepsin A (carboxypeptidase C)